MDETPSKIPETSSVVSSRPRTTYSADTSPWMTVASAAGHIGYLLAIPAVVFVMGGAWLDKYMGTSPLFVLIGLPLALLISAMSVIRLIKQLPKK